LTRGPTTQSSPHLTMRLCDRCHTLDGQQGDWLGPGDYPSVIE